MPNPIENDPADKNLTPEVNNSLDPRVKLRSFLPSLPEANAYLLRNLINDKNGNNNSFLIPDKAINDLVCLIEPNWKIAQKKIKERQSAEEVDVMSLLEPYNHKEKAIIIKHIRNYQMNTGCTGGCPWCGFRTERGVQKAFSIDSSVKFWEKYGKYNSAEPKEICQYYRSDPFDWVSRDGKYDYTDQAKLFIKNVRDGRLAVSTVVPEGTEMSVIKFIFSIYSEIRKTEEKSFSKFGRYYGQIRFSQTNNNRERIDKIMQFLRDIHINEGFLREIIVISDRENGHSKYRNVGYFVNSSNREEHGRDMTGLLASDELILSPLGLVSESAEIATLDNPEGIRAVRLIPGMIEIPEYVHTEDYAEIFNDGYRLFTLLPKHKYRVYENGEFKRLKTVESVRRDALAFCLALDNLNNLAYKFSSEKVQRAYKRHPTWSLHVRQDIESDFIPQYEKRRRACMALFSQESDQQAIEIATKLISKIDDWLEHIDEKMKISD
jgi:hypothetical protein